MATDISVETVRANELTPTNEPNNGQSFVMIDRTTNEGLLISYNMLVEALLQRLVANEMPEDGLKMYIIGDNDEE